jgi:AmmeMemoRadiSam system protein A
MSLVCAALMCHAPIVLPEIGGQDAEACAHTTAAMHETARIVVAHAPEVLCIVSPHAPRKRQSFGVVAESSLTGDFSQFGHPELRLGFAGAPELALQLTTRCKAAGVETHVLPGGALDHGALVPLHFMARAGYRGKVLLIALPHPDAELEQRFGRVLGTCLEASHVRTALIASGDMSHRLLHGAPGGYHADAKRFDASFVAALQRGALIEATGLEPSLVALAGEDVIASTRVAASALGPDAAPRVVCYEGPFGVGYCEALLRADPAIATPVYGPQPRPLVDIARDAVGAAVRGERWRPAPQGEPKPVFVTLRGPKGDLRGCIGRTEPLHASLSEEVADCAAMAATMDTRMLPVAEDELAQLRIEVSVLNPAERVAGMADLAPERYGVVVRAGQRRGVLLPAIEGVETPEEQVRIALRKAGISSKEPFEIARFTVTKQSA